LHFELQQCRDEGKDVRGLAERITVIQAMPEHDPQREWQAAQLLDETASLPIDDDFPYHEPSDLPAIQAARPPGPRRLPVAFDDQTLFDKIYGAWLGRCAGCLLGKPVEGWRRQRLVDFNQAIGNYPIHAYMSSQHSQEIRQRFDLRDTWWDGEPAPWINNVACAPADDDTNYTLIALQVLERYGHEFSPLDVASTWLESLPILQTCTAERVAYRNLTMLIPPPASAVHRNVYREWIGAQIRGDLYGYINPGQMEVAASMAWRDASLSHVKNGIYGAMWVAAMLAAAYTSADIPTIIRLGLGEIPARSRLAAAIAQVLHWPEAGLTWEQALDCVHKQWDETNLHHWCHVIPNAMIVAIGLFYGQADLERSIGIAVSGAFDTDCNGATVGSIVGLLRGAKALPEKWTAPLADRLRSHVLGFAGTPISELARRTACLVRSR
jgi:ADP-ribosylglycohydrolase